MDQEDLNMEIPLLIQEHCESGIYIDKFNACDNIVEDESNLFKNGDDLLNNEAIVISTDSIKELISGNSAMDNHTYVLEDNQCDALIEKPLLGDSCIAKDDNISEFLLDNNNCRDSEIYLNGQMIELADGTTAFLETSRSVKGDDYSQNKLYNGNVIYVVSGPMLNNDGENVKSFERDDKAEEISPVIPPEQKQEKSKGFQCSYENCNKSYSSFHHLKVPPPPPIISKLF